MAMRTKRWLQLDPVVWPKLPAAPGFHGMPAHQAKEGALLLLEAGAPAYPTLVRMADRAAHFTMEDAQALSDARIAVAEKVRKAADDAKRIADGRLKVIEPVAKADEDAEKQQIAAAHQRERMHLSRFPVRKLDCIAASVLLVAHRHGGTLQLTEKSCLDNDLGTRRHTIARARKLMAEGVLKRLTTGGPREAANWALTTLGRQNAEALMAALAARTERDGGSDAEKA